MQAVRSRLTKAQCLCTCPFCLSTANTITRRATTATARRTLPVGNVVTLSLSSLAAGLAFADSRRKDDRRKQWDKVIGETRAAVEATEIEQQNRLAALLHARVEAPKDYSTVGCDVVTEGAIEEAKTWVARKSKALVPWVPIPNKLVKALNVRESKESIPCNPVRNKLVKASDAQQSEEFVRNLPFYNEVHDTWLDVFKWAREQHRAREAAGFLDWKGPSLTFLQSLSSFELSELLSHSRLLRCFYGGEDCANLVKRPHPWVLSHKKIRVLEWSIAKLVANMVLVLLKRSSIGSSKPCDEQGLPTTLRQFPGGDSIPDKILYMEQRLSILILRPYNEDFCAVFERPPLPNYDRMIVAGDEPTTEMNRSLQHLLVLMEQSLDPDDIISEICYHLLTARAPPDTETYNMLLVRFSSLAMDDQFKAVLSSMRESKIRPNEITHTTVLLHYTATRDSTSFSDTLRLMEGLDRGLVLANPDHIMHPILAERYVVVENDPQRLAEKARMNGQVYEALIVGAMEFSCDGIAMWYYRRMVSEGWSPTSGTLLAILQDCCRRLDWAAGYEVLQKLKVTAEKVNTLIYEWTLRLCQRCRQNEFFDSILIDGVRCGALPASILDLTDQDKAEDIGFLIERAKENQPRKASSKAEEVAVKIAHRIGYESPYLMENVFYGCKDQETLRLTLRQAKKKWRVRYALERKLDGISRDIEQTFIQATDALYVSDDELFVKSWLSRRVKQLDLENKLQETNSLSYNSYNDMVEHQKAKGLQRGTFEYSTGESSNSGNLPLRAHSSYLPPTEDQQHNLVQWNPPDLRQREYPLSG